MSLAAVAPQVLDRQRPPISATLAIFGTFGSLVVGTLVVALEAVALKPLFFALALPTVIGTTVLTARRWRDPFNPLSVIAVLALFRFSVPALLVAMEPASARRTGIFRQMGLSIHDVSLGHVLALMGLLACSLPWLFGTFSERNLVQRAPRESTAKLHAAVALTVIGFFSFLMFVRDNGGLGDAAASGSFRSEVIREGTGQWWYGGLFLISGSVFMSAWLAGRGYSWRICLAPSFVASCSFFIMGGRARAITPIVCALLMLWWLGEFRRPGRPRRRGNVVRITLAVLLTLWIFSVGAAYRGGGGITALWSTEMFSATRLQENMLSDLGQVHALAGVVLTGPGATDGKVLAASLAWPVTKFTPIVRAPSAGVEILRRTAGEGIFGNRKYGLLPSIPGEAYLDFGLPGLLLLPATLGWILKRAYASRRSGRISLAANALVIAYLIRIYFESSTKISELWVVLLGVWLVGIGAQILGGRSGSQPDLGREELLLRLPAPGRGPE